MMKMVLKPYKTKTDTTRFLVPLLGYSRELIETDDFINAYLYITSVTKLKNENEIILVYSNRNLALEKKANIFHIKNKEKYIYFLPVDKNKLNIFIKGKYSKFKEEDKQIILSYWKLYKHSRMHNIFYPTDFMFEIAYNSSHLLTHNKEIWPKPNPLRETFILKT